MSSKAVIALLVALAALVGILLLTSMQSDTDQPQAGSLFEDLRDDINAVSKVTVTGAGSKTVATLVKTEAGWTVEERSYPADLGKLRQLLLALADAQIVEAMTANPDFYPRLGVEDIGAADAGGVALQLTGGTADYSVIVGDAARGDYRYVRRGGETQSWLIDQDLSVPEQTSEWLAEEIVDLAQAAVHAVRIAHPDGAVINLAKSSAAESDFTVTGIPEGRELSYPGVANVIGGVLADLNLDDVAPEEDLGDAAVTTTFSTFDGRIVEVKAQEIEGEAWIQLAARYDQVLAARFTDADEDPDAGPSPPEPTESTVSASEADAWVEQLNQRTSGWRYRIPQYKFEQLTRNWSDLLKSES